MKKIIAAILINFAGLNSNVAIAETQNTTSYPAVEVPANEYLHMTDDSNQPIKVATAEEPVEECSSLCMLPEIED